MTKVFLSGSAGSRDYRAKQIEKIHWRLFSMHGSYVKVAETWCNEAYSAKQLEKVTILLDSGAFTAWSKGEEMPLSEVQHNYRRFMKAVGPHCKDVWMINLDKIPGEKGRTATHEEIQEAVRISDENFKVLFDEFGDRVMPVFHQDESIERLHECCHQNPVRICVSPRNDVSEHYRRPWAARVHMETQRYPGLWTHGLAATGADMMATVPWGSVDSSTHLNIAAYGGVLYPYRSRMMNVKVSNDSPMQRFMNQHINSMPEQTVKELAAYIETCETTLDECRVSSGARELVNICTLQRVADDKRVIPPQDTLFMI